MVRRWRRTAEVRCGATHRFLCGLFEGLVNHGGEKNPSRFRLLCISVSSYACWITRYLNLASDFDVAEGRWFLLDVEGAQKRVRGAFKQLEMHKQRLNTTMSEWTKTVPLPCMHRLDKHAKTQSYTQTYSPGRTNESSSLLAVGK